MFIRDFFPLNNGKSQFNLIKLGIYHLNKKPKGEIEQKLANLGNHINIINNPDSSHLSIWPFSGGDMGMRYNFFNRNYKNTQRKTDDAG